MDTITPHDHNSNPLEKLCKGPCGRTLPATPEYFHRNKKMSDGLLSKCKECGCAQAREYTTRPEVKEHRKAYKKEYRSRPEVKEHVQEYCKSPKVKGKQKEYRSRMEVKEHIKEQQKEYYARPEIILHRKEHNARLEVKLRRKERESDFEFRRRKLEYMKKYSLRSEVQWRVREYRKDRYAIPEIKMRKKARQKEYGNRPETKELRRVQRHNRRARLRNAKGTHTIQDIRDQYKRQKGKCYYCLNVVRWEDRHVEHVVPLSRGGMNDVSNLVIACISCNCRKHNKLPHEWPEGGRLL